MAKLPMVLLMMYEVAQLLKRGSIVCMPYSHILNIPHYHKGSNCASQVSRDRGKL